jgi:L-threonylcarbamoyladenylate synthase
VEKPPSTAGSQARKTERLAADGGGIARAAALLAGGGLVAFPTETVYGLGADGRDPAAVASLYGAKERPRFNPLIAHVTDRNAAYELGLFDVDARALAEAFWPGPLTIVVPATAGCCVSDLARAGLESVAIRVPAHPIAAELLRAAGFPVVAPSANRSGRVSPTTAAHVWGDLDGRIDAVVEGGSTEVGVESTIVACLAPGAPVLLRPGGVTREAIERVLGRSLAAAPERAGAAPLAPGALESHYAPRALVRLDAVSIERGEAALLFGRSGLPGADTALASLNLSETGDLAEAASCLFGHLRGLDGSGAATIAVAPIPEHGLGEAINDRLRRAAAAR